MPRARLRWTSTSTALWPSSSSIARPACGAVAVTSPTTPLSVTTGMPERTPSEPPRSTSTERNHGDTSWPTTCEGRIGASKSVRISAIVRRRPALDQRLAELEILLLELGDARREPLVLAAHLEQRHIAPPAAAREPGRQRQDLLHRRGELEHEPRQEAALLLTARHRAAVGGDDDQRQRAQQHDQQGNAQSLE
jgi:hypothetical protein